MATASILTFAFNNPEFSHQTLIAGMYVNLLFLLLEARLIRNYIYVFGLLLLAWLGRLFALSAGGDKTAVEALQVSGIPMVIPVGMVAVLYFSLVVLLVFTPKVQPPEQCYWPDPAHLGEDIPSLDVRSGGISDLAGCLAYPAERIFCRPGQLVPPESQVRRASPLKSSGW